MGLSLSRGRWRLRASAGGIVLSKVDIRSSSLCTIHADHRYVSHSFHAPLTHLKRLNSCPTTSANPAHPAVPIAPAQRAGRLRSWRTARSARHHGRSHCWGDAAQRRSRGRDRSGRTARRAGNDRAAEPRDGGPRASQPARAQRQHEPRTGASRLCGYLASFT